MVDTRKRGIKETVQVTDKVHKEVSQKVFFGGQMYDACSLFAELVSKAGRKLVLVDNYADGDTLNILAEKRAGVKVILYTAKNTRLTEADIRSFNEKCPLLEVRFTRAFHDKFLIIDDAQTYHIGAPVKDDGKRSYAVNLIADRGVVRDILERLRLEAEEAENEMVSV